MPRKKSETKDPPLNGLSHAIRDAAPLVRTDAPPRDLQAPPDGHPAGEPPAPAEEPLAEALAFDNRDPDYRYCVEARGKSSQEFDKLLTTLAGGALAISIGFVQNIWPQPVRASLGLLGGSWIAMVCSLLFTLWSHDASIQSFTTCIGQHQDGHWEDGQYGGPHRNRTVKLTRWAGVTFLVGVGLLVAFALWNLAVRGGK